MTPQEERQLLRHVRGIYKYKVGGPVLVFLLFALVGCGLVLSFLLVGVAAWLTRLFSFL